MGFVSDFNSPQPRRRKGSLVLALCWLWGLISGLLIYLGAGDTLSALMRSTPFGAVSIVSLLCVTTLPFLISAFAVSLSSSALLMFVFARAFSFAFTALGVFRAFGSAGWLLVRLVLFSNWGLLPLLYFLWLRLLAGRGRGAELGFCLALAVLVFSIDYRIISPLLASLIE